MRNVGNFIRNHPLVAYAISCFVISWGTVLWYVGIDGFPARPNEAEEGLPAVVAATLLGPSMSGAVLHVVMYGTNGTKQSLRDRYSWKPFYAILPLFAPSIVGLVLGLLCALTSTKQFFPAVFTVNRDERSSFVLVGLAYAFAAGTFEELGWSFFFVSEMLKGKSILDTGVVTGLVWGIWHFLVAFWGSGNDDGLFSLDKFVPWIPWNFLVLPAYRILMVYVFELSGRSVWAMSIMHGSLTASLPLILMPTQATGVALASFYSLFAVSLGGILFSLSIFHDGGGKEMEHEEESSR